MSNERDTHFLGFARALLNDIFDDREGSLILGRDLYPQDNERVAQHIARRAYDLGEHILMHHTFWTTGATTLETAKMRVVNEEAIKRIPDMTEFPK